jgi:hypothetical protein
VLPASARWLGWKSNEQYAHAVEALSDPERTRLFGCTAAKSTLQVSPAPMKSWLRLPENQYLIINGVLPAAEAEHDVLAVRYGNGNRRRWQIFPLVYQNCRQILCSCSR